jgi:hypothetical protein
VYAPRGLRSHATKPRGSNVRSPLGAYTIIYAFKAGKDAFYYMSWGLIIFAAGIASALYKMVNVIIILGVLLIVLAVMGLAVYWRKK